ncbi:hypothetical protein [Amycolatopsis sp. NPDC051716]
MRAPLDEPSPSELRVLRYLPTNLTRPEIAGELRLLSASGTLATPRGGT